MEQIRLNIVPQGVPPVCHVSQYDAGRVVRLILMDGLQGYVISDETFVLNVRKPDDTVVTVAVAGVSGDSFVDFVTTEQMAAVAGENICELKITKDDTVIGSLNFRMKVERDPLAGGIESQSEIHNLHTQVAAMVSEEVADQYDSDSVIFDDEATTGHGTGYVVSSEYINELEAEIDEKANSVDSWLLTGGILIPANSDLNTYSTTGNFVVVDNSRAATLSNLPVQEAGTLKVFRLIGTTARYICQVYMSFADSKFYKRYSNNQGDSWKPWNTITTSDMFDTSLSSSSTNAVQNKVVKTAVDAKANKADALLLSGGTAITNNTNLNTITTAGSYYIAGDSIMPTILNAPSANSGKLEVFSSLGTGTNYVRQVYTDWKTKQFVRYTTNGGGTWTAWESVINGTGGGAITLSGIIAAGYITGSGNYVTCTIPMLNMANSATITAVGNVNVFTPEGAIANAVQLEQSSVVSLNHHGITVEFRLKTAQTANRPCTVQIASGLTFTLS